MMLMKRMMRLLTMLKLQMKLSMMLIMMLINLTMVMILMISILRNLPPHRLSQPVFQNKSQSSLQGVSYSP